MTFNKIWVWFVASSKDPQKLSLTLKGLLPFLALLGVADSGMLDSLSNSVVDIIVQIGTLVTGVVTLYGAVRKVYLSLKKQEE